MKRERVAIYGIGSLAYKLFEYNKRDGIFDIVCFVDDKQDLESTYCGLPAMHYEEFKAVFNQQECKIFVAIGYVKCNYYRELISKRVMKDGYDLVNYISPRSICWEGSIVGKNVFVADNVFVGHGCKLHNGVIIYESCTFSHDSEIEPYCFISLSVASGGFTKVGHNSFIGLHSTIKDDVVIGPYNIVGSGTNVIRSTKDHCVIIGNPGISKQRDTELMKI